MLTPYPGTGNIVTPLAKSTPMTQALQMPISQMVPSDRRDILEPLSNEQARTAYLARQIQGMSSVSTIRYAFFGRHVQKLCELVKKDTNFLSRAEGKKNI